MTKDIIKSKAQALNLIAEQWRNEEGTTDVQDEYTVVYFQCGPCVLYNMTSGAVSVVKRSDDCGMTIAGQDVAGAARMVVSLVCSANSHFHAWINQAQKDVI